MAETLAKAPIERRKKAFEALDQFFESIPGSRRLTSDEVGVYSGHSFETGWSISKDCVDGVGWTLHVLFGGDIPYVMPRIAVSDGPSVLEWPHLEPQGLLCLAPLGSAVDIEHPVDVVSSLLKEAVQLIDDCVEHRNEDHFRDEFHSYWRIALVGGPSLDGHLLSLIEPRGPSRRISVWRGKSACLVAEDDESAKRWLQNRGVDIGTGGCTDGLLIWLSQPLVPTEYPESGRDLLGRIQSLAMEEMKMLTRNWNPTPDAIFVILGAPSRFGTCLAGIVVVSPSNTKSLLNGFRHGKVPPKTLLTGYLAGSKSLVKAEVYRTDHLWIHGRDGDNKQGQLRQNRVALIGCGSVGGQLARLLAQAGVGHLLLVDPEMLVWANTGRHCLGARSVRKEKAKALAEEIKTSFPHIGSVLPKVEAVGPSAEELMKELLSYELIITTAGNWAAESFLNDWQQSIQTSPPILYGWVEEHALAAHAVLIPSGGPCFQCGVNGNGRPNLQMTEWPEGNGFSQEPACGALYSPYGPAELAFAHSLLSQTVIDILVRRLRSSVHRIWIAELARIKDSGGRLTETCIKEFNDVGTGGRILETQWRPAAECPVCMLRNR